MATYIDKGAVHIAYRNGEAVGVLGLHWNDAYWPDDELAGYVHGLAVRTEAHGLGVGQAMLGWAGDQIGRKRRYLRLDCPAGNGRLRRHYEAQGFTYRGEVTDHEYLGAL